MAGLLTLASNAGNITTSSNASSTPLNSYSMVTNAQPRFVAQPSLNTNDVINAIATGLQMQGIVNTNIPMIGLECPQPYTITVSGNSNTKAYVLNNDILNAAPSGTITFSDNFSGTLYNGMIPNFMGKLYFTKLSVSVQNSSGNQNLAALQSAGLQFIRYNADGSQRQINIPQSISPQYYQSGTLEWNLTSGSNPLGIQVIRGLQLSYTPVAGNQYTFIFEHSLAS